jgi:hypothetical protein
MTTNTDVILVHERELLVHQEQWQRFYPRYEKETNKASSSKDQGQIKMSHLFSEMSRCSTLNKRKKTNSNKKE